MMTDRAEHPPFRDGARGATIAERRGAFVLIFRFIFPFSLTQLTTYTKPTAATDPAAAEQRQRSTSGVSAASGASAYGSSGGGGGDQPLPPGMIGCLLLPGVGRGGLLSRGAGLAL